MISTGTPWTILLGADEYNPIEDLGPEPFCLYVWLRSVTPTRATLVPASDDEACDVDRDGVDVVRTRFGRREAPVDLTKSQVTGALESIRSNGWSYGHRIADDGNAADVYLGVYDRTFVWAADARFHELLDEGVLPEGAAEQALRLESAPVAPAREMDVSFEADVRADVDPDDDQVSERAAALDAALDEAKQRTDEVLEREKQKWRDRGQEITDDRTMGYSDGPPSEDTPWGFREDGELKRNKHGLWRLYQRLFEREFDVPPPSLWTDSGKPSKNAHRLGKIVDEYSIDVAMEAVGELVTRWDEVQSARSITAPPVPAQIWRLKDTVCYAIESGEDPVERLGGEPRDAADEGDWDGDQDDESMAFNVT